MSDFQINDKTEKTTLDGSEQLLSQDGSTVPYDKITTQRIRDFRASALTCYEITYASTVAVDRDDGAQQKITLTGNWAPTAISNVREGEELVLKVSQDGTGGHTLTWPSAVKWQGGTAPTLTSTASAYDTYVIRKVDGVLLAVEGQDWS